MSDSLYRRLAREYGAKGARESDIERLRDFCGGWLPPDYESFLYEVGDCSEMDFSFIENRVERVGLPFGLPFGINQVLGFAAQDHSERKDQIQLNSLVIGSGWSAKLVMALSCPSVVFRSRGESYPAASASLLAGSFAAYEQGLILPPDLMSLQGEPGDRSWKSETVWGVSKFHKLDEVRGLAVFDALLDRLVEEKLPERSPDGDRFRLGIIGSDHRIFTEVGTSEWPIVLLLGRFEALSAVLEMVVHLDQIGGTVIDTGGLFSDRFDAEYSKAEIVDILVDRLGGARCLDELALLFREKFSVPAAKRLMAAQRG